ncbi:glycine cleavage system aminomethyltransferase GcvT [Bartonella tamiae]|uniref:aminomethyltransferase n=1 Tax=Bartonella tamiae Th239 TaxID=1094558 RepID=J1JWG9_9HYPH|nr:glycine cleavage system aminomethyltransferase GcvT [Bartonella tamiae]EJF89362.1 glycine cleavage system T protein [Bartonella tamiae Th239]EJF92773.1 glycine cleavage system T protein [Bartonella tamiae Th307]
MVDYQKNLKHLPLHDLHEKAGAKFGAFAGWNMPLTYPLGVMKEHLHTRAQAGLFDISHMKLICVEGSGAADFLNYALPIDAHALKEGQSRYNYLLNENAGIIDDLIVTRLGQTRFMIVANAGNAQVDIEELQKRATNFDCHLEPLDRVFLALQGPAAKNIIADLNMAGTDLTFMQGFEPQKDWFMTRSGYTGEDGFEIALPEQDAVNLAEKIVADPRVEWIGLAARDSLRLEAGLCLHGNDITVNTTPIEAKITWAVSKSVREKAAFVGAQAFLGTLSHGTTTQRIGLKPETRQPVRSGADLFDHSGKKIGHITSGGFGPSYNAPVAMGYVETQFVENGTKLFTKVRGKDIEISVHSLPFIEHRYFKG